MHACPQCQSENVAVGAFVLECFACGWHYLNRHPCAACGQPARGVMSCNGESDYRCAAHPFTKDEMRDTFRRAFAGAREG